MSNNDTMNDKIIPFGQTDNQDNTESGDQESGIGGWGYSGWNQEPADEANTGAGGWGNGGWGGFTNDDTSSSSEADGWNDTADSDMNTVSSGWGGSQQTTQSSPVDFGETSTPVFGGYEADKNTKGMTANSIDSYYQTLQKNNRKKREQTVTVEVESGKKPRKKRKWPLFLLLLLLIGGAAGAWWYMQQEEPVTEATMQPLSQKTLLELSDSYTGGTWDTSSTIQDVEWNSDTMDKFYISYRKYIVACDKEGHVINTTSTEAEYGGLDYYDGKLISTLTEKDHIQLVVLDANKLEDAHLVELPDVAAFIEQAKADFPKASIKGYVDALTIAPSFEDQQSLKIYLSCGVWSRKEEEKSYLYDKIQIMQYDYRDVLLKKKAKCEKVYELDLGTVQYGLQNLEYDRDTGDIWCAVRSSSLGGNLFCIKGTASGNELALAQNGGKKGWNCSAAGDGICSLGNGVFYLLSSEKTTLTTTGKITKCTVGTLESALN